MQISSNFIDSLTPSAIRYITTRIRADKKIGREIITFAGGMPCSDFFPTEEELLQIFQSIMQNEGANALQYAATDGYDPLREQIALLVQRVNIQTTYQNILVTAGSQQALNYISRALIAPGDLVLCEDPTYVGALDVFRSYTTNLIGVPMEDDGMDLSTLEEILKSGARPRFLYTIPDFQNPTGRSMSVEKRKKLAELAKAYSLLIIEDAPYSLLAFDEPPRPAIKSFDTGDHVIYLGSFSKIVCPGLRVGYVIADPESIGKLVYLKQRDDLQTDNLSQRLVCGYLRDFNFEDHLNVVRRAYRERRDAMVAAINASFPAGVRCHPAGGGMFLWIELPKHINARSVFDQVYEQGFAYVPGEFFYVAGDVHNTLRLNFCSFTPDEIAEKVQALGKVISATLNVS